jgi:integrase
MSNVYQRPDTGTWEFRKTIRGRKYYESIPEAQSKLEAEVAAATILKKIYEGKYGREGGEIGAYDFCKFCDVVYLPHARGHLRQPAQAEVKVRILKSFFRGRRLREITLIEIEKYRRWRYSRDTNRKRPPCGATVRNEINALSAILNLAIDNDLLASNPCGKLKWKRGETVSRRERILSAEEEEKLLAALTPFFEASCAVRLALNTGMRRMEILRLKETDVDFAARSVSFVAKGGKPRTLPLNGAALEALRELYEHRAADGHLFRQRSGRSISYVGAFGKACLAAGISGLTFHDLRRTFSARVQALAHAFTVRDLLGHADVQTTNDHYSPQSFALMRAAVDALAQKPAGVVQLASRRG